MVSLVELKNLISADPDLELVCRTNVNLYDSPTLDRLATQAVTGRQLRILSLPTNALVSKRHIADQTITVDASTQADSFHVDGGLQVCLREDDYPGWVAIEDLDMFDKAETPYQPMDIGAADIRDRLPDAIRYTQLAMHQSNHYLWGGTVGPNYDCSGLMQAAFLSVGIWIPRDAYQQEAFTQPIALEAAEPGDLIFFGTPERTTHVGLHLGDRRYIHSSGKEIGRNGIGIDELSESGDVVSQNYVKLFKQVGRVITAYPALR